MELFMIERRLFVSGIVSLTCRGRRGNREELLATLPSLLGILGNLVSSHHMLVGTVVCDQTRFGFYVD